MLVNIIQNYLAISEPEAQALIALLNYEKRWHQEFNWKESAYSLQNAKTQDDVISFMQAMGQTQWFSSHDRSRFPDNVSDKEMNNQYFDIFRTMGLTQELYLAGNPTFSVVLGSSEERVKGRVETLKQALLNDNLPLGNIVFGLGCNRQLNIGVIPNSENQSKQRLEAEGLDATEMNMITLTVKDMLKSDEKFANITYHEVNTARQIVNRDPGCAQTKDTAESLKSCIENLPNYSELTKPITVYVYSCQPFVLRQQRDVQEKLGDDYVVRGAGAVLSRERYLAQSKSVSIVLGEIGRLININFTPKHRNKLKVALTDDELQEIQRLIKGSELAAGNNAKPSQSAATLLSQLSLSSTTTLVDEKDNVQRIEIRK